MTDVEAALRRNDRFLFEFVEAHDVCPYARRCRETGALDRRVLLQETLDPAPLGDHLVALSTDAFAHVEVALLLLPNVRCTFAELERFTVEVRALQHALVGRHTFYIVPFHPDAPLDDTDPHRIVPFLRRSPDPTLQLVRADLLERIRGPDVEDTIWIDPATLDEAPLGTPRKSVSTKIAEANHATVRRVGVEALRRLLASLRD